MLLLFSSHLVPQCCSYVHERIESNPQRQKDVIFLTCLWTISVLDDKTFHSFPIVHWGMHLWAVLYYALATMQGFRMIGYSRDHTHISQASSAKSTLRLKRQCLTESFAGNIQSKHMWSPRWLKMGSTGIRHIHPEKLIKNSYNQYWCQTLFLFFKFSEGII